MQLWTTNIILHDRQMLIEEVPSIINEDVIIKHNYGVYYTLFNDIEHERHVCRACLYGPTHRVEMPRERERNWVCQLTESDMQSLQQYQSSDHKAMLEEEEAVQRDLENRDRMHTSGGEITEKEAEMMKGILERQRNIQERIKEDELALRKFEQSNVSSRCPPRMYEDRVRRNEEIPLYQNAVPQESLMSDETSEFSDSFHSSDGDSEDDFDSDSDGSETSENTAGVEIFHQVMKMECSENLEMSREWLTMAQTFFLYHYLCSQKDYIEETEIDVMTGAVSSLASSLVNTEFLKFTKVLASLCMLSDVFPVDPSQRLASFLRGLLYCCNEHGYLSGASALQCTHALLKVIENGKYNDPQLLQMVPSFTQATVWCVCSFTTPFSKLSIEAKELKYLVHLIQTYQVPLFKVKDACMKDSFPPSVIRYLQDYVNNRPNKGIIQIEHEFLKSNSVTEYMLNQIVITLSSGKHTDFTEVNVAEMKDALSRIASGVYEMWDDDLLVVIRNLHNAVFQTMGYKPRITQLASVGILLLSNQQKQNRLLEVLTGEGKSCIIAMFAAALGVRGTKVDIITSSPVLARRDAKTWADFYQMFRLTVTDNTKTKALLESSNSDEILAKAYKSTVVYGTVLSFSGDVLREIFSMDEIRSDRGFQAAIVDEVDMLMMDEGISLTYLSHRVPVLRHIEPVIALVWSAVQQNTPLWTENEKTLFAGTPDYFHNIVFDRLDEDFSDQLLQLASQIDDEEALASKLNDFFCAEDDDSKREAMEMFGSYDMLNVITLLNRSELACNITVYSLTQGGILELVEHSDNYDSTPRLSVIIQDRGMVFPLYTPHELQDGIKEMVLNKLGISDPETDPEVVLQTEDGAMYHPGNPGDINTVLSKCLSSVHLLRLMAQVNIARDKTEWVLASEERETKANALESFTNDDICNILSEIEEYFPHRLDVYCCHDHYHNRLIQVQQSKCKVDSIPVLLMDKGKLCILQEVQDDSDDSALQTQDGQRFIRGVVDLFHNIIFRSIDPIEFLHMLELLDGTLDLNSMLEQGEVFPILEHLEKYLKLNLVLYRLKDENTLVSAKHTGAGETKQPQLPILVLEDGRICRLHHKERVDIPNFMKESDFVQNQLPRYIQNAFHALVMTENREYLVSEDGDIHPIDFENTGVVQTNRTWSGGLQQMLEMKHHIQVSPISVITNFLSHIGFFRRYGNGALYGLSGTIGTDSDSKVLKHLYGFHVSRIPTYRHRLLYERETVIVKGDTREWLDKIHAVLEEVICRKSYSTSLSGAAALVLCEDIRSANLIKNHLSQKGMKTIPYTRSDVKLSETFEDKRRKPGDIIVATNLAGRGTDIKVTKDVNESGGLFILMTFLPRNRRVELQAFGRTARQGNPGSVQCILQASSLPAEFQLFDNVSDIRELREEQESLRLKHMVETDVERILFKEDLFSQHCNFLNTSIRPEVEKRDDKKMIIDAINENWGQWLEMKEAEIDRQEGGLRDELTALHEMWRPRYPNPSPDVPLPLPKCNFYHLVKFGNQCLFERGGKISPKGADKAYHYYSEAIRMESKFTMIPYYNRACCRLVIGKGDNYLGKTVTDLRKAKELLQVYLDEVLITHQCAMIGEGQNCKKEDSKKEDNNITRQMEVRIQILQHFGKTMDETIDQVNKLKASDNVKVVPTSILHFIPEADIVTNEELYGLRLLGLEVAFTVKKKKKFSWQAFGVFLLGIGQAIAGVGITVLSGGTLTSFGMGLISEGVSDIIDGVQGMITGEFDLKDWAISKACSIAISVACGGVGKFIARGAKAAVKGVKAAKGFRAGAKALAKSAKAGKSAVKSGAKAVGKDAKVMWKVAKSGRGSVMSSNLRNAGKLVGKELLLQGAMCGLNKVENMGLEQIFKAIGKTVAENIKRSLQQLFAANDRDSLGHIVNVIFERADHTSEENIKAVHEFFEQVTDHVVESLVQNDSTAFDESAKVFRNKLLPGISSHLKGKAAGVAGLVEVGFVAKSIATTSEHLSKLNGKFEVELVDQCKVALKDKEIDQRQQTMHQSGNELVHLKRDLAEHTAVRFGEAVTSVLQQNLSWAVSRGLSKTVNGVAAGHMSKKLKVQETKTLLKAGGERNYLLKASPTPVKKVDRTAMKSHADGVLNVKNIRRTCCCCKQIQL